MNHKLGKEYSMNGFKKSLVYTLMVFATVFLVSACSSDDYLNAIPEGSTALISVDLPRMAESKNGIDASLLKALFHVSDASKCGIDVSSKVYLFESPDGNLGLAAKIKDADNLNDQLTELAKKGTCQKPKEKRGKYFTVLNKSWLVGFDDDALLVMGPATGSVAQAELMRQMGKYLDAEEGIKGTPLYDCLQEVDSPIAMVAQAQALPVQYAALFTLGAPQNADPSQVLIAASMTSEAGCLLIDGTTFSFDASIDKALKASASRFHPVKGLFLNQIPEEALFSLAMNVDGTDLLQMMKDSKAFRALLTGVSLSVDMDEFVKAVEGDFIMVLPEYSGAYSDMLWNAELKKPLESIDTNHELGKRRMTDGGTSLPKRIADLCKGKRMAMVVNLHGVQGEKREVVDVITSLLNPLFGEVNYIVCSTQATPVQP